MQTFSYANTEDVVAAAVRALRDALTRKKDAPLLFLLSGGSTFALLTRALAEDVGRYTTIGMLDERYTQNLLDQNFVQLTHTDFYTAAQQRGCTFINTVGEGSESLPQCADRFSQSLHTWVAQYPNGRVVATQGIGADGHTAGILPFPEDPALFVERFDDPAHWVVGYETTREKNPHTQRITITLPFLRSVVHETIVYAVGKEKHDAIRRTLAANGSLAETPTRILHAMRAATLFTDDHAS